MNLTKSMQNHAVASMLTIATALVPSTAFAQAAPTPEAGGFDDIVVTAQRREQSMQSVPLSIAALSSDKLAQSNVVDLRSITRLSPGIQIQPQFVPGNAIFQIRGQGNSDTGPTIDPSVGIYFDDVYVARSTGSLVNLVDVSRVEILKGAQGTLFGKNSAGGVIRLVSNRPTDKFEGYAKAGFESYDKYTLEAVVNAPLGDKAAVRLVGQYANKTGGYANDYLTNQGIDKQRDAFIRGSLKFDPTNNLSILIQGDYSDSKGGGLVSYLGSYYPDARSVGRPEFIFAAANNPALEAAVELGLWNLSPATQPAALVAGRAAIVAAVTGPTTSVASDVRPATADSYTFNPATRQFTYSGGTLDPTNFSKAWGFSAHIDWKLGDINVSSITAYRHLDYFASYNLDGSIFHFLDTYQSAKQHQFSQEIVLNGTAMGDKLNWTAGGLYFYENAYQVDRSVTFAALSALRGAAGTRANQNGLNKSYGLFGQATYKLTDALSLTGGLRWSKDNRTFIANSYNVATTGNLSCVFSVANGIATQPGFAAPCELTQKSAQNQWSYSAAIDYKIDSSKLIYFRTGRGYRAGGFNPRILAPESLGSFRPEVVTDYEFGIKADWLDNTLRTNLALFRSTGKDVQLTRSAISATTLASLTFIENRGKRTIEGAELEINIRPVPWLEVNNSLSYMNSKLDDPANPKVTWVQHTPVWAWTSGVSVEHRFSNVTARLRGDLAYRGKMFDTPAPFYEANGIDVLINPIIPDLLLLNARFSLKHESTGIELSVYGRNLSNELYPARQATQNGLGLGFFTLGEPRVFGVELKVPFGASR